jgi:hypothetical protein
MRLPVASVMCGMLLLNGCEARPRGGATAVIQDSLGVRVLDLPSSPSRLHALTVLADSDWATELPLTRIDDVRALADGTLALLDSKLGEVWAIAPSGAGQRIVRRGPGPGEVSNPLAIAPHAAGLVVWDAGRQRLASFDALWAPLGTTPHPRGDVNAIRGRVDSDLQDYRLRLRGGDAYIWLLLEESEMDLLPPSSRGAAEVERNAYLTRAVPGAEVFDTILSFRAQTRLADPRGASWGPPLFSSQTLWAATDSFVAIAQSDSARVTMYGGDGGVVAVLRWPPVRRRLDVTDKRRHARAFIQERHDSYPREAHEAWADERTFNQHADRVSFADAAPQISGLEAVDACVWVSLFDLAHNSDGVSTTWAYVNVRTGAAGAIRFNSGPVRTMHFTRHAVWARAIDSVGVHRIRRYSMPEHVVKDCSR